MWYFAAIAACCIIAAASWVFVYLAHKRQQEHDELVKILAVAVAGMHLEQVEFLEDVQNPDDIQFAVISIVNNLKLYRPYLPQSVLEVGAQQADALVAMCCRSSISPSPRGSPQASHSHGARQRSRSMNKSKKRDQINRDVSADAFAAIVSPCSPTSSSSSTARGTGRQSDTAKTPTFPQSSQGKLRAPEQKGLFTSIRSWAGMMGGSKQDIRRKRKSEVSDMSPGGGAGVRSIILPDGNASTSNRNLAASRVASLPRNTAITLLCTNRSAFLPTLAQLTSAAVSKWMALDIDHARNCISSFRGCVDTFCADHVIGSFAAVRPCPAHRQAAVKTALRIRSDRFEQKEQEQACAELAALPRTCSICSGHALCGDFGSSHAQRFMSLGSLNSMASTAERLAAKWGISVLIDDTVHADADMVWPCRLAEQISYAKRSDKPLLLWEIMEGEASLGETGNDPWSTYNEALHLYLNGQADAAVARAQDAQAAPKVPADVADRLAALQKRIASGVPPTLTVEDVVATHAQAARAGGPLQPASTAESDVVREGQLMEKRLTLIREAEKDQQLNRVAGKVQQKRQARRPTNDSPRNSPTSTSRPQSAASVTQKQVSIQEPADAHSTSPSRVGENGARSMATGSMAGLTATTTIGSLGSVAGWSLLDTRDLSVLHPGGATEATKAAEVAQAQARAGADLLAVPGADQPKISPRGAPETWMQDMIHYPPPGETPPQGAKRSKSSTKEGKKEKKERRHD